VTLYKNSKSLDITLSTYKVAGDAAKGKPDQQLQQNDLGNKAQPEPFTPKKKMRS
jgi:hypothetical protein